MVPRGCGLDARSAMLFATPCATPTAMRRHRSLRSTEPHHLGQRLLGSPCPACRLRNFAAAAASTAASAFRIGHPYVPAATSPTRLCEATARLCRRPSATLPPPFCDFAAASAAPTTNSSPASSSSLAGHHGGCACCTSRLFESTPKFVCIS